MGKKKRKAIKSKIIQKESPLANTINAPTEKKAKPTIWKNILLAIGLIASVIAIIANFQKISEVFKSPKEKYDEENFISGELRPLPIKTQDSIVFSEPSQTYTFKGITEKAPRIYGILIKKIKSKRVLSLKLAAILLALILNNYEYVTELICLHIFLRKRLK